MEAPNSTPIRSKFSDYLPVGERELDWGLYVTVIGFNRVLPGETFPSSKHPLAYQFDPGTGRRLPEYQLVFLTEGRGTFSSETTETLTIEKGTAFMLFPDVWHSYRPDPATGWEDYWIGFNGSYIYELCRRRLFTPEKPLFYPQREEKLIGVFERLLELVSAAPMKNSMLYSAHAMEILAFASEIEEHDEDDLGGKRGIVDEAVRIIWGWSYRTLSVDDIARSVNIKRRTLERYFRETLDRSVLDEIIRCRLTRARRLLENTRIPIARIALMAGFSSPLQMRRTFLNAFQKTPEQYRKRSND